MFAQKEGESLATYYSVWRLRRYLYGSKFHVVTDHKPLQPHYNKRKFGPMRVERHKMRLQGFNFELIWEQDEPPPWTTNHGILSHLTTKKEPWRSTDWTMMTRWW